MEPPLYIDTYIQLTIFFFVLMTPVSPEHRWPGFFLLAIKQAKFAYRGNRRQHK